MYLMMVSVISVSILCHMQVIPNVVIRQSVSQSQMQALPSLRQPITHASPILYRNKQT